MSDQTYDFIIVGGGSAGSALGNRLSSDPSNRVLVIEAGHNDRWFDYPVRIPAAMLFLFGNPLYDWCYRSEPEPWMADRRIDHYRGKVLGGSSSINGMFFQRGNPLGYDAWAAEPGMGDWDFAHCLPYFKRMETSQAAKRGDAFRGHSGPLIVERMPATNPLHGAFLESAKQAGYELVEDVNGRRQEGFAPFESNIHNGERLSASKAYLHPVMRRPNLDVRTKTLVTKILFEGKRAAGVEIAGPGRSRSAVRGGHVVLCGGAINSPQLLQLSGVGDGDELRALGIDVVQDLPGVGENLQDHVEAFVMYACQQPISAAPYLKPRAWPKVGAEWILRRSGPAATNHFEVGGFIRANEKLDEPNIMMCFLPLGVRNDGTPAPTEHSYQINLAPQLPEARGTVKVRTADPKQAPEIRCNYLSTEQDRQDWVDGVRLSREILAQSAMEPFNGGEIDPGPELETDEQIIRWVGETATTMYHVCGTAKMGTGPDSVVDPATMGVHGVDGLSVVDASVFPRITNANTYAPVMMVAEKAADLILGQTPMAPEHSRFYRHGEPAAAAESGAPARDERAVNR
jgi:choline dehydrogenase